MRQPDILADRKRGRKLRLEADPKYKQQLLSLLKNPQLTLGQIALALGTNERQIRRDRDRLEQEAA